MKIMLLHGVNNKMLLDTLRDYYITEEFRYHIERIASVTSQTALELKTTQLIMLTVNKLLLINTYRYVECNNLQLLMSLLNNQTLHMDMVVPVYILAELTDLTLGGGYSDYDIYDVQSELSKILVTLVGSVQRARPNQFVEAHVHLVEGFSTFVPVGRVSISRIDFTPTLVPMAFYKPLQ